MSRFFISRPIFASVISIVIVIAGLVASRVLPIAQYPQIAPPTVLITATYPGASAETLAKTVAAPIEEQLNGVEGLLYFNSSASANGSVTITATFEVGTNVDMASVNVNNRVKAAEPRLPEEVRRNGVIVQKRSTDILQVVSLQSTNTKFGTLFLSNYASLNIVDELKRLKGVGDVTIFGAQDYSMRVWLRPDRMAQLGITTTDIANAISAQNAQNAAGKVGQAPSSSDQMLVYTVTAKGRLLTPEEFGNIVIRSSADGGKYGGVLRLKDVARVELGAYSYDQTASLDGKPTIAMGVFLQTGANALEVAELVKSRMNELQGKFPEGVSYVIPFDTTHFVSASIEEVVKTLIEAMLMVLLVVFVFLQNWRATLIPMIAVPISLIGTFAGLYVFGFSINTLTLFALVLAIGIVVDDAIIILENVERLMSEKKLSPFDAAVEAMREVTGAIVAIVLVLCAVFVPVAFLGGIAGKLYQQFAVTVAIAVVISGTVALTLTPALCALLLKPTHTESKLFAPFNRLFGAFTRSYTRTVGRVLRFDLIGVVVFAGMVGLGGYLIKTIPGSFVPSEDQGYLISALMLPDGATLKRTQDTGDLMRQMVSKNNGVDHTIIISGFDLIGGGNKTNAGTIFMPLKDWSERKDAPAESLAKQFSGAGFMLPDGLALVFNPPPIMGLGSAGGFEVYVQNRVDGDAKKLNEVVQGLIAALKERKELTGINTFFRPTIPQLFVEVDEPKALSLGVSLSDVYTTLQSTMGALYVNDFNKAGRVYRVQLQAEPRFRQTPDDIGKVYVRSATTNAMIPISAFARVKNVVGPEQVERFNGFIAAKILGNTAPGISSGDAIRIVEETAKATLPSGYDIAWTGQAYQEKRSSGSSAQAFGFAIIMVFLILAAQYEKWTLPIAVIMAVPFALFGALAAIWIRGMPNDIYFQIGLVVLIGLASKNAILIVEFAAQKYAEGMSSIDAAIEAARLRFRPIVMTSLAFAFGVFPLVKASGAGAAARQSMGTGVFGGMLAATFIATLFIPLFFKWLERGKRNLPAGHTHHSDAETEKHA
ncbi:multidrug efflux RND transporter permease subunit [Rhodocyclus tenuis]|uniref:Efflux pump membrane transporter n=2 Tax=Rhodocyclus TaxID=1064 RepID=A0A6L5JXQ3_RHOTE|nr:multidrug efflux RND transporter permease subunit [Rhodocyclus gracilis]MQY52137.1 multidrug efflux RND transporter permease subunit [Rhodocyclus gracilis]MRD72433.1 multidrug efflux RND transporter permease subunit [Rhodocyclus gracilis]NJA89481.1 multidrug efflux RND transporter permease subunit [Rhodocyclus gracilis]